MRILIRKSYRNAIDYYVVTVHRDLVKQCFGDVQETVNWIGEHTEGGSSYGYTLGHRVLRNGRGFRVPKRDGKVRVRHARIGTVRTLGMIYAKVKQ